MEFVVDINELTWDDFVTLQQSQTDIDFVKIRDLCARFMAENGQLIEPKIAQIKLSQMKWQEIKEAIGKLAEAVNQALVPLASEKQSIP